MPFDDGNRMPGGTYEDYDYPSGMSVEMPEEPEELMEEEEIEEKPVSNQDKFFEKLLSRIDGLESRLSSAMTNQQSAQQPRQTQNVDDETGYAHSRASAEYKQVFDELIEEAGGDYVTDEVKKKCHEKALRAGQKEERLARAEYRSAKMEELMNPHYEMINAFKNASPEIRKYLSDPSTARLTKEIMNNVFDVAHKNNATTATAPVQHRTQGKAYISPRSVRNTPSFDDEQDQSQDLSAYFKAWGMKQPAPRRRR